MRSRWGSSITTLWLHQRLLDSMAWQGISRKKINYSRRWNHKIVSSITSRRKPLVVSSSFSRLLLSVSSEHPVWLKRIQWTPSCLFPQVFPQVFPQEVPQSFLTPLMIISFLSSFVNWKQFHFCSILSNASHFVFFVEASKTAEVVSFCVWYTSIQEMTLRLQQNLLHKCTPALQCQQKLRRMIQEWKERSRTPVLSHRQWCRGNNFICYVTEKSRVGRKRKGMKCGTKKFLESSLQLQNQRKISKKNFHSRLTIERQDSVKK